MAAYLEADRRVLGAIDTDSLPANAVSFQRKVGACNADGAGGQADCCLQALFGQGGLEPARDPGALRMSTVTAAFDEGRGSCAALVAAALALTEPLGEPFEAVVLRDHVLLASRREPDVYFEVLDGGRVLGASELRRYEPHPPGGPVRVSGRDYLPYYLDNLAARLVESGDAAADRTFRAAIALNSKAPRIRYNYGTFLLDTGDASAALEQLDRAIHLGWKDADAFVNRGVANWKLSRLRDARRDFRRALKLDPGNHRASTNLRRIDESTE